MSYRNEPDVLRDEKKEKNNPYGSTKHASKHVACQQTLSLTDHSLRDSGIDSRVICTQCESLNAHFPDLCVSEEKILVKLAQVLHLQRGSRT